MITVVFLFPGGRPSVPSIAYAVYAPEPIEVVLLSYEHNNVSMIGASRENNTACDRIHFFH